MKRILILFIAIVTTVFMLGFSPAAFADMYKANIHNNTVGDVTFGGAGGCGGDHWGGSEAGGNGGGVIAVYTSSISDDITLNSIGDASATGRGGKGAVVSIGCPYTVGGVDSDVISDARAQPRYGTGKVPGSVPIGGLAVFGGGIFRCAPADSPGCYGSTTFRGHIATT